MDIKKMVASTDIKFYVHTNNNAPQLQNAYGSMINVLNACLVDGINIGAISSLTASGKTVTATFSSAHNLMQYQVIKITGAVQAEFNGEHRVLIIPNALTVTFELEANPSVTTATGMITASLPPLGFNREFQGTQKAVYRSKNTLKNPYYLRVDDSLDPAYTETYAKYAKVGVLETCTGIDDLTGVQAPYDPAFPEKNWIGSGSGASAYNGWAKWYYARGNAFTYATIADSMAPANGSRNWLIVGNNDSFLILPSVALSSNTNHESSVAYMFGVLENENTPVVFLSASLSYTTAGTNENKANSVPFSRTSAKTALTLRSHSGLSVSEAASFAVGLHSSTASFDSGALNTYATGNLISSDVFLVDSSNVFRNKIPFIKWIYQAKPYLDLSIVLENGDLLIAKNVVTGGTTLGQILLKIGEM